MQKNKVSIVINLKVKHIVKVNQSLNILKNNLFQ